MSEFKVDIYNASHKIKWNNFALNSNQDSFLFQRDFMDYHSDRFKDYSLMIYEDQTLVALLPANKVANVVYSHQGLTYGGLITRKHIKSTTLIKAFRAVLVFLSAKGITRITLKELPSIYLHQPTNNLLPYLFFITQAKLLRTDLHSVVEVKDKTYSKSRKNGIKRGERANLRVEEVQQFDAFWNDILIANLSTKHGVKPVHSLEEITLLKSRFKNNIRQFNVFKDQTLVAGTTIFETENVAHCQYISANAEKNALGSLDFLHDYLISTVFKDKQFYDFGTSNINGGLQINEGLLYWKEGFGARSITQGFYDIDTQNYKLLDALFV